MLGDEHQVIGIDLRVQRFKPILQLAAQLVAQRGIKAGTFFSTRPKLGEHLFLGRVELRRQVHLVRLPRSVDAGGDWVLSAASDCHTPSAMW